MKILIKTVSISIALLTLLLSLQTSVMAGTTGWVNGYEARRLGKSRERHGVVLTKIQCKNGASDKGDFRKNMLIKADYRMQDKNAPVDWVVAWHTAMKQFEIKYERKGFKLVSRDSFRRATGLKIECALWHRPRKK